ncbi:MAG: POTRA domain-containing protein [Bacteroidales bacterium]|jgi:outer membrane protein assembly factor BamA|nr:POTRA domain-containing protein [Bacteroidales bacterium]
MKPTLLRGLLLAACLMIIPLAGWSRNIRIDAIEVTGNQITKDFIILRELPFSTGDTIAEEGLEEQLRLARENLNNLLLFNFVEISRLQSVDDPSLITIIIQVEERWYIWPLIEVKLEERNLSTWLQNWDFTKITIEAGARIDNFLGLKHKLVIAAHGGYQWGVFLGYRDISLDREGKHFMSVDLQGNVSRNLDIYTGEDKPARFNMPGVILEKSVDTRINYTYRPDIRTMHNISLMHEFTMLADTVLKINPHYWGNDQLRRNAFRLNYRYRLDQRDYHPYPLNGYFLQAGLNTYITTDATVRYAQLTLGLQYFKQIPGSRWYLSTVFSGGYSLSNTQAYILERAIGYDNNMMRGYEYTVADGQSYAISNNTVKFNLLKKRTFTLNWLSFLPKFNKIHISIYANAHFDMGYAHNKWDYELNSLGNQFLYAGGLGLDLVTYYDMVIGIDYSVNKQNHHGMFSWKNFFFSIKVPFI